MKVLYEVSNLGLGHLDVKSRTGIFRTVENLLDEIVKRSDLETQFISNVSFDHSIAATEYFQNERPKLNIKMLNTWTSPVGSLELYRKLIKGIHQNTSRTLLNRSKRKLATIILMLLSLPIRRIKTCESFDIYHSLFYALPKRPDIHSKARILTIYDVIPILFPQYFLKNLVKDFKRIVSSVDIQQDWVICISESTKTDFCKVSGMSEARVFVTSLAAAQKFYPEVDSTRVSTVTRKYGIFEGGYILGLSTLEPRKNVAHLIRCFFKLITQNQLLNSYLVLVGAKGWLFDDIFRAAHLDSKLQERVVFTGHIPDQDLSAIYSGAKFFVYPSLYEGFGLPPLEAMQCGVPVITSNTSSLPEVVGDAGITVDPMDEDALCEAMLRLLNDDNLCQEFSRKGLERSRQFSWEKCVDETIAIYQKILDQC